MAKENTPAGGFDVAALVAALDAERISRKISWKDVAEQSGVSASTLTRLSQGRRPDVDSFAALTTWLNMPADRFMGLRSRAFGSSAPLTQISAILRDDPNLNPEGAAALEEMIKATYKRLRKSNK
jgi:transcriptional regulator with XRE-family HTH domain